MKDKSAFPISNVGPAAIVAEGMTLREWYAGMALQGHLAGMTGNETRAIWAGMSEGVFFEEEMSKIAFSYADAMISQGSVDESN